MYVEASGCHICPLCVKIVLGGRDNCSVHVPCSRCLAQARDTHVAQVVHELMHVPCAPSQATATGLIRISLMDPSRVLILGASPQPPRPAGIGAGANRASPRVINRMSLGVPHAMRRWRPRAAQRDRVWSVNRCDHTDGSAIHRSWHVCSPRAACRQARGYCVHLYTHWAVGSACSSVSGGNLTGQACTEARSRHLFRSV